MLRRAFSLATLVLALATPAIAAWLPEGNLVGYGEGDQGSEQICTDGAGGAFVAWFDSGTLPYRVRLNRLLSDGTVAPGWPANGLRVAGTLGPVGPPQLASDGAGGAYLLWRDDRSGTSSDLYAQRVLSNGTLAPGWPLYGLPVSGGSSTPQVFYLVSDGLGGMIAAWRDVRTFEDPMPTGLYMLRMNSDGTRPAGWNANGNLVTQLGAIKGLVADGAGGALLAWDYHDGAVIARTDAYVQRIAGDGAVAPGWPAAGLRACFAAGDQYITAVSSDGAGGMYLAFLDNRIGDNRSHLFGQHVTGAGAVASGWSTEGNAICTAPQTQDDAFIVPDGFGGAFYLWQDWRLAWSAPSNNTDIYAQRVTANGTALWATNGVPLVEQTNPQNHPAAVADGEGGVLASWVDYRGSAPAGGYPTSIYAQHLDANGVPKAGWQPDGNSLTNPPRPGTPSMIEDGAGGAIVAAAAYFSSVDVFAARLDPDGEQQVSAPTPSPRAAVLAIGRIAPNPATGPFRVELSLPRDGARATLELLDLAGRRIESREVGALGAGVHSVRFGDGLALAPGVYRLRLTHGGESRIKAIAIIR